MHEISVMKAVIDTVLERIDLNQIKQITELKLKIGEFSGVCLESLRFAFEAIEKDVKWQNTILSLEKIPLFVECLECGYQFYPENTFLICTKCQGICNPISGKELEIESIQVDN